MASSDSSPQIPKAALYYYHKSIWASAPLLALEEKGYGPDEIDLKEVDLSAGEQFAPSYLRLNPNATVPTLVVPLHTTLSPDVESRYKAIQDTKSVVEFLDKSRSTRSRTHTTSTAPSPSLAPATMALLTTSNTIIDLLHSPAADPNALTQMNARTPEALGALGAKRLPIFQARGNALSKLLAQNEEAQVRVSEKTRAFWQLKKVATDNFIQVFSDAEKGEAELSEEGKTKRQEYFAAANALWTGVKGVFATLQKEMIGPYALGDQLSVVDLHLAPWLARIAMLAGATAEDDGNTVIRKIESHVGGGFSLPKEFSVVEARRRAGLPPASVEPTETQSTLAAFWDAMKERPSWKKVYADGLH